MRIIRGSFFWWFIFTLMFLLALDFWSWSGAVTLSWLNLPPWVFYFICLQIGFAFVLAVFALKFWQTPKDD